MSDKYLRCKTLTGKWWCKDMETGEDLPMYATPIERKSWQDLNNECSELNRICKQLKSQLQQKENKEKEIREYIEKNWISQKDADNYRFDDEELNIEISDIAVLFDILDKEVN